VTRTPVSEPIAADLATQVARLFYDRQLSKVEIAERLGISRFRVARLIDAALAGGLVRIEYRDTPDTDRQLAREMEERFGLHLCVVAGGHRDERESGEGDTMRDVARLAGAVIGQLIGPGDVVGVACGSTLAATVREVAPRVDPSITVVQLAGSSSQHGLGLDAGDLARQLAERLGGRARALFAPTLVESSDLRDALLRQPDIAATVAEFGRLSLAVVGIGAMPSRTGERSSSSLLRSGVLDEVEIATLRERGAVGDLVVHPFDRDGAFVAPEMAARAIAVEVADLRRVRRVIAVSSGAAKAEAIRGALATGVVQVLITDRAAANGVLRADGAAR
jgi:DNA-binding transcriptional regulator LsrR (DeoR family)